MFLYKKKINKKTVWYTLIYNFYTDAVYATIHLYFSFFVRHFWLESVNGLRVNAVALDRPIGVNFLLE